MSRAVEGGASNAVNDKNGTFPLLPRDAMRRVWKPVDGKQMRSVNIPKGLSAVDVAVLAQQEDVIAVFARALNLTEEALLITQYTTFGKMAFRKQKSQ